MKLEQSSLDSHGKRSQLYRLAEVGGGKVQVCRAACLLHRVIKLSQHGCC